MLEKLIKLAGEGGVADDFTEGDGGARETREVRAREADKTRREVDGVADNFTEGDEFPERRCRTGKTGEKRSGEAREVRAGEIFRQNIETEARVIENAFGWSDWRSR